MEDEHLAQRAIRQGAQDYLVKGRHDGPAIARAIRYAIDRKGAEEALRKAHAGDHEAMFNRVAVDLGAGARAEAMAMQYGRYLLMSCSRPGGLPANLQGLWLISKRPAWRCNYHTDVNVQMNYWLPDAAGLPECFEPLVDLTESLVEPGQKTAKIHYGARGWTVHTVTNVWGYTSPGEDPSWGMTPTSGPWLINNLWDHYAFTQNKKYLKRLS